MQSDEKKAKWNFRQNETSLPALKPVNTHTNVFVCRYHTLGHVLDAPSTYQLCVPVRLLLPKSFIRQDGIIVVLIQQVSVMPNHFMSASKPEL